MSLQAVRLPVDGQKVRGRMASVWQHPPSVVKDVFQAHLPFFTEKGGLDSAARTVVSVFSESVSDVSPSSAIRQRLRNRVCLPAGSGKAMR